MLEQQINIQGLKINYKIAGDGPVVLVLHGWGSSSDSWIRFQEILAQKKFKVIVPDLPGFGKSDKSSFPWDVNDYTYFIFDFIKNFNEEKYFILGHSFGGRIAIKFAAKYPEKLRRLILCAAAGVTKRQKPKLLFFIILSKIGNVVFFLPFFKKIKPYARKIIYFLASERDYHKIDDNLIKETFKKIISENLEPDLEKIKSPTLIIWGKNDQMTPVADAYLMHQKITGATLKILPGIKHGIQLQAPEKLADLVYSFINIKI